MPAPWAMLLTLTPSRAPNYPLPLWDLYRPGLPLPPSCYTYTRSVSLPSNSWFIVKLFNQGGTFSDNQLLWRLWAPCLVHSSIDLTLNWMAFCHRINLHSQRPDEGWSHLLLTFRNARRRISDNTHYTRKINIMSNNFYLFWFFLVLWCLCDFCDV